MKSVSIVLWNIGIYACLLFAVSSDAWGQSVAGAEVTGPGSVPGDGITPVGYRLVHENPRARGPIRRLRIHVDAGTISAIARAAPGSFEFVPPRVVVPRTVAMIVEWRRGRRSYRVRRRVLVTPPSGGVGEQRSTGPFAIAAPSLVHLGAAPEASLTMRHEGGPMPHIHANIGQISEPQVMPNGRLSVTYQAPKRSYPQLAIIGVIAHDGSDVDWIAMPLAATARIKLDSEPRASVSVEVGGQRYGPVTTGSRGRASLTIAVPPGVTEATTHARDKLGNLKRGVLPLAPPPPERLLLVCPQGTSKVLLFATTSDTRPLEGAVFDMSATRGRVSAQTVQAPGLYTFTYSAPRDIRIGDQLGLTATLRGDTAVQHQCTSSIPGEYPHRIRVQLSEAQIQAGKTTAIQVILEPEYPGQLPRLRVPLQARVDFGSLSELVEEQSGRWTGTWSIPTQLENRTQASLTVQADGPATGEGALSLRPGPVASLQLDLADGALSADGVSTTRVEIRASDSYGNAVPNARLELDARGGLAGLHEAEPGRYVATYTAPFSTRDMIDRLEVVVPDTQVMATRAVRLHRAGWRQAATLRAGYQDNLGKISNFLLEMSAEYRLPMWQRRLGIGLSVGYYGDSDSRVAADMDEMVATSVSVIPIVARASISWRLRRLSLYFGLGVGVAYADLSIESPSVELIRYRGVGWMTDGIIGAEIPLGPGFAILAASGSYAPVEQVFVNGNLGGVQLTMGYRYPL